MKPKTRIFARLWKAMKLKGKHFYTGLEGYEATRLPFYTGLEWPEAKRLQLYMGLAGHEPKGSTACFTGLEGHEARRLAQEARLLQITTELQREVAPKARVQSRPQIGNRGPRTPKGAQGSKLHRDMLQRQKGSVRGPRLPEIHAPRDPTESKEPREQNYIGKSLQEQGFREGSRIAGYPGPRTPKGANPGSEIT